MIKVFNYLNLLIFYLIIVTINMYQQIILKQFIMFINLLHYFKINSFYYQLNFK